jgi:hypothetical protein
MRVYGFDIQRPGDQVSTKILCTLILLILSVCNLGNGGAETPATAGTAAVYP